MAAHDKVKAVVAVHDAVELVVALVVAAHDELKAAYNALEAVVQGCP